MIHSRSYLCTDVAIADDPLPVAVALAVALADEPHVLYERDGRVQLGFGALAEITVDRHGTHLRHGDAQRTLPWDGQPLRQVASLLNELPVAGWRAYGWAAFELAYARHPTDEPWRSCGDQTLLHLVIPRGEALLEPGRATLRGSDQGVLHTLRGLVESVTEPDEHHPSPVDLEASDSTEYRAAVASAVAEIRAGHFQKVILSRTVKVPYPIDLARSYLCGRRNNTPARSFLLSLGRLEAAGFSPETVVEVYPDGRVSTQPLAGTRARSTDEMQTRALRDKLLADPKEIHEHAVSVKLAQDELSEVCRPGSVTISEFMAVRQRGSVQHLASRVSGQLQQEYGPWDAFAALFPAVTASGIPKREAYRVIARHEQGPRGLYSGAVIVADHTGALDVALALRTVFRLEGQTWLQAGAGIVEQSFPDREFEETREKLASVAPFLVPTAPPRH